MEACRAPERRTVFNEEQLLLSGPVVYLTTRKDKLLGLISRVVRETFLESPDLRGYKKGHAPIFTEIPENESSEYMRVKVVDPSSPTPDGYRLAWVRKGDFTFTATPLEETANLIQKNLHVSAFLHAGSPPTVASDINALVPDSSLVGITGGLRMVSAASIIGGSISVAASHDMYVAATKTDDLAGQRIALSRGVMGGALVGMGVSSIGHRTTVIIQSQTPSAITLLALKILGIITTIFYSVAMGALLVRMGYLLKCSASALLDLLNALKIGVQSGLAFLVHQISLQKDDYDKAIPTFKNKEEVHLFMRERKELSPHEEAILSENDLLEIESRAYAVAEEFHESDQEQIAEYAMYDMMKTLAMAKLKKRADFVRSFGEAVYARVAKEGDSVLKALAKDPTNRAALKQAEEITSMAKGAVKKQTLIRIAYCIGAIFAIAGGITGLFFTAGIPLIVITAIALFGAIAILISDLLIFIQELKSVQRFTKKDIGIQVTLMAITAVSLTLGCVFSAGLFPLILITTVGGGMLITQLGTLLYAWYKSKKHLPPKEVNRMVELTDFPSSRDSSSVSEELDRETHSSNEGSDREAHLQIEGSDREANEAPFPVHGIPPPLRSPENLQSHRTIELS